MANEVKKAEEGLVSNVYKVKSLMQSQKEGNKGAFSALSARFKDIQRKINY